MARFTRIAIELAFWKLLSEKTYTKITVKDIVETCGINRNTFYYHFSDLQDLAADCVRSRAMKIVEKNLANEGDTLLKCLFMICGELEANKKQIMSLYNSTVRISLESFTIELCGSVTERYIELLDLPGGTEARYYDKVFIQNAMFGHFIGWLNSDMRSDYRAIFYNFCRIADKVLKVQDSDKGSITSTNLPLR